jgi:hypothetical protein
MFDSFFKSISRGWGFFKQAIDMAVKDHDLIKPTIMGFFANIVVGIFFGIPLIVIGIFLSGLGDVGNFILFLAGGVMIFAQYIVSYIFSGMTVAIIYDYLTDGDGNMDTAWDMVKREMFNIITLAAASALVTMLTTALRSGRRNKGLWGAIATGLANLIDSVWTTATYFVLPAMVVESLNLPGALKRATKIITSNLLLVGISEIGIGWIVGGINFVVIIAALALAVALAFIPLVGIIFAVAWMVVIIALLTMASSYINTAYHTCMFLWAREAEKVQAAGKPLTLQTVPMPAPLAAVMGA